MYIGLCQVMHKKVTQKVFFNSSDFFSLSGQSVYKNLRGGGELLWTICHGMTQVRLPQIFG